MATLAAAGVTLVERPEKPPRLLPQQEASLALILRESVTNIVRHAEARSCSIVFRTESAEIVLEVQDDGQGMQGHEGNGVRGMRERVADLGGDIVFRSAAGKGTVVSIRLPQAEAVPTLAAALAAPLALTPSLTQSFVSPT